MKEDKEGLDRSLFILNKYLYDGFLIKTNFLKKHDIDGQKEAFDLEQLHEEYRGEVNKWLNIVAKYLFDKFEKYLYFHFIQPKADSMDYLHPLGKTTHALDKHLYALEDVIMRIEERRNLVVRQEIAEKEYEADTLYKITYNDHTREVKLNNIVLTKTDFDSENDNCFDFIYRNPNRPIGIDELEQVLGGKLKKRLAHIVRDLGFTKEIKTIFFPVVTKSQVKFVNPISKQYYHKNNLPPINFKKLGDKVSQSKSE